MLFLILTTFFVVVYSSACDELEQYCWGVCGSPLIFPFREDCFEEFDSKVASCRAPPGCNCVIPDRLLSIRAVSNVCEQRSCSNYNWVTLIPSSTKWCQACGYDCNGFQQDCINNGQYCRSTAGCAARQMCVRWRQDACVNNLFPLNEVCDPGVSTTSTSLVTTKSPTGVPTTVTRSPTISPTLSPTVTTITTNVPTEFPTLSPTISPTVFPTVTTITTSVPTLSPTNVPTEFPSETPVPTETPTKTPVVAFPTPSTFPESTKDEPLKVFYITGTIIMIYMTLIIGLCVFWTMFYTKKSYIQYKNRNERDIELITRNISLQIPETRNKNNINNDETISENEENSGNEGDEDTVSEFVDEYIPGTESERREYKRKIRKREKRLKSKNLK